MKETEIGRDREIRKTHRNEETEIRETNTETQRDKQRDTQKYRETHRN